MTEKQSNILLIEDNLGDARLIQEILAEETSVHFTLQHTERLASGFEILSRGGVDVVLLDLSLPDSQGLDTFQQLHTRFPDLPIVVLTALDDEEVAVET